ncbi:MAG TPA: c-type cytochrome [Acidobacteriaceae bacterium]|nr:c-type cytochrome [Acidobacteriaceae bacterium]
MTDSKTPRRHSSDCKRWIYLVCLFAFAVRLSAQTDLMKHENVQRGRADFQRSCAICHGTEAMGGVGPNLVQSSLVRHDENGNLIAPVIQDGRPDKGMPAFPMMNSAEISDVVAFLHARVAVASVVSSEGLANGYSLQQLLTGNAEAGKQYFYGAGRCATCHSPTGDLAGIARKYSPADLEARFLYPPDDNVTATVTLSSGKERHGKLLHLDAFYVAIMDQEGWYRSWPMQQVKVREQDPLTGHLDLLSKYTDKDIHDVFAYLETLK